MSYVFCAKKRSIRLISHLGNCSLFAMYVDSLKYTPYVLLKFFRANPNSMVIVLHRIQVNAHVFVLAHFPTTETTIARKVLSSIIAHVMDRIVSKHVLLMSCFVSNSDIRSLNERSRIFSRITSLMSLRFVISFDKVMGWKSCIGSISVNCDTILSRTSWYFVPLNFLIINVARPFAMSHSNDVTSLTILSRCARRTIRCQRVPSSLSANGGRSGSSSGRD